MLTYFDAIMQIQCITLDRTITKGQQCKSIRKILDKVDNTAHNTGSQKLSLDFEEFKQKLLHHPTGYAKRGFYQGARAFEKFISDQLRAGA